MALTSAVAAAAAASAAAAGAGKKAAQVQLQAELNNDDEWDKFLMRDGLLVVDVYSEWCGPCIGMVGNLKKIKVEIGGDNLHLAVAGQLLNVVFGADAPRLAKTIEEELHNEELAKKGELQRPKRAPHELTPPEQEIATAQEKLYEERRNKEAAAVEEARFARRELRAKRLEMYFADICPGLMLPHAQKNLRRVNDVLEPLGVLVADKCPILVGKEGARYLAAEDAALGEGPAQAALIERPSLALLLKKLPEKEGCVIEICRRAIFGDGLAEEDSPQKTVADELMADNVPGIHIPADRHQRAAILDLLFPKMVQGLAEAPAPPSPPHICMVFGAWQRRAVLAAAGAPDVAPRLLRYGLFAGTTLLEPRLLCKTADQYDQRPDKDYNETIVVCIAVGAADPVLCAPEEAPPSCPPPALLALGPLHVSADAVEGGRECAAFFPAGYSAPENKPKPKTKKKKKGKKQAANVEEAAENAPEQQSTGAEETNADEVAGEGDADGDGEGEAGDDEGEDGASSGEGDNADEENGGGVDKATSPPPP